MKRYRKFQTSHGGRMTYDRAASAAMAHRFYDYLYFIDTRAEGFLRLPNKLEKLDRRLQHIYGDWIFYVALRPRGIRYLIIQHPELNVAEGFRLRISKKFEPMVLDNSIATYI